MKDKQSLISTLLSRYYDGSATPTETATLRRLLDSLDDTELTPDLRLERDLMHALYDVEPTDDADIPSDLEARLEAATIGAESRPKVPVGRRSVRLYRALAVAASLVLVLGIAWRFTTGHAPAPTVSESLAQVTERTDTARSAAIDDSEFIEIVAKDNKGTNDIVASQRKVSRPRQYHTASAVAFKEVTDSAEAAALTLAAVRTFNRAMSQVGENLTPAMQSVRETERQLETASQIIKQSLI